MVKRLINIIIVLPVAVILIVMSVANRQTVTLALNPFRPEDSVLSVNAPFFIYLFAALILGMLIGALATWWTQGKHRKNARVKGREAARWQNEAGAQRRRAEELAENAIVPVERNSNAA